MRERYATQAGEWGEGGMQKAIITISYATPLDQERFDTFTKKYSESESEFWGNPIMLGKKKVHIYGVDKKFWKPIFIELTDKRLVAVVEQEYAEDVARRLIRICQVYAGVEKAYIGDKEINVKETHNN
jgi:hypothetical protein